MHALRAADMSRATRTQILILEVFLAENQVELSLLVELLFGSVQIAGLHVLGFDSLNRFILF